MTLGPVTVIVQNAVICNKCEDYIVSKSHHDFVTCSCGHVSVDGGQAYCRRVFNGEPDFIDMSWEIEETLYKACAEAAQNAIDTNRNKFGIANAVMRALREKDRIIACGDRRVIAKHATDDELIVEEPDGTYKRWRLVEGQ